MYGIELPPILRLFYLSPPQDQGGVDITDDWRNFIVEIYKFWLV